MPRRFEQPVSSDDIGLDESFRTRNRAIDVALGGKMENCVRLMRCEYRLDGCTITNIRAFQDVAATIGGRLERFRVGGVSELVDIDNEGAGRADQKPAD